MLLSFLRSSTTLSSWYQLVTIMLSTHLCSNLSLGTGTEEQLLFSCVQLMLEGPGHTLL